MQQKLINCQIKEKYKTLDLQQIRNQFHRSNIFRAHPHLYFIYHLFQAPSHLAIRDSVTPGVVMLSEADVSPVCVYI